MKFPMSFLVVLFSVSQAWAQGATKAPQPTPPPSAPAPAGPARPGTQPGAQPAARPGTQPGAQPAAQPGTQPGAQPAAQPSAQVPAKRRPKSYIIRLREIAERIESLKEQVSQTKYRLNLLKEAVLHGTIAGCALVVELDHRMGSAFRLTSVRFALDGKLIFGRQDIASLKEARRRRWPIFSGPVPPGPHVLTVELRWRGYGHKVFSYLRGYKFRVLSSFSFKAAEGTETHIRVVAYEKGNRVTTPLKDRPAIKFKTRVRALEEKSGGGK